jgi:hypothetical protein
MRSSAIGGHSCVTATETWQAYEAAASAGARRGSLHDDKGVVGVKGRTGQGTPSTGVEQRVDLGGSDACAGRWTEPCSMT